MKESAVARTIFGNVFILFQSQHAAQRRVGKQRGAVAINHQ